MSSPQILDSETEATTPAAVRAGSASLQQLIDAIAAKAEARELANEHPYEAMRSVHEARLGALRLAPGEGGGGASLVELFETVIALAAADPAVAHILRAHFEFAEVQIMSSSPRAEERRAAIARGEIFGSAATEIGTGNVGASEDGTMRLATTLAPDEKGDLLLNGTKYYCTGTLYSDWALVYASRPDDSVVIVVVPTSRDGVTLEDDWDGMGQGRTGTGTTRLDQVRVRPEEVIVVGEDPVYSLSYRTAFPQLYLTAVIAGILRSVVADAAALMRGRRRTFSHAPAGRPEDDPALQQVVGRIAATAFAAEASVMRAAQTLGELFEQVKRGSAEPELAHLAALRAAEAKVVVDELAARAATELFDVGGASATKRSKNLDRHWRNVRTLASHNPTVYKALALGDYYVNGAQLPQNGYF